MNEENMNTENVNSGYMNTENRNVNYEKQSRQGNGFGIASMVLGIISLALFCMCINIPLAILAIVFGIVQLVRYEKKSMGIAGIVTGGFSIVAFVIYWALVIGQIPNFVDFSDSTYNYEEYMPHLFDDMDSHDFEDEFEFHYDKM